MKQDDIIKFARDAGITMKDENTGEYSAFDQELERFAELVAAAERKLILSTVPGDWGSAYDAFKAGAALPNDAPALMYAFAAGMIFEREECAKACDSMKETAETLMEHPDYSHSAEYERMCAFEAAAERIRSRSKT